MKFFLITISVLCSILSFPLGMSAETYVGSYDGRPCTLIIENDMKSEGQLAYNRKTFKLESFPDVKEITCEGTLEIYIGGYMNFNLLSYYDEGGETYYETAQEFENNPKELFKMAFDITDYGKAVVIWDMSKDPYFGKVKLKLMK